MPAYEISGHGDNGPCYRRVRRQSHLNHERDRFHRNTESCLVVELGLVKELYGVRVRILSQAIPR